MYPLEVLGRVRLPPAACLLLLRARPLRDLDELQVEHAAHEDPKGLCDLEEVRASVPDDLGDLAAPEEREERRHGVVPFVREREDVEEEDAGGGRIADRDDAEGAVWHAEIPALAV